MDPFRVGTDSGEASSKVSRAKLIKLSARAQRNCHCAFTIQMLKI